MIRWLIKYAVIFVVLVLIQVLFLNQMQISGYLNPYMYILFVMLLPLSAPRYIVLLSGFFSTLLRVVLSSLLSIFVIVLSQFLIFRE